MVYTWSSVIWNTMFELHHTLFPVQTDDQPDLILTDLKIPRNFNDHLYGGVDRFCLVFFSLVIPSVSLYKHAYISRAKQCLDTLDAGPEGRQEKQGCEFVKPPVFTDSNLLEFTDFSKFTPVGKFAQRFSPVALVVI